MNIQWQSDILNRYSISAFFHSIENCSKVNIMIVVMKFKWLDFSYFFFNISKRFFKRSFFFKFSNVLLEHDQSRMALIERYVNECIVLNVLQLEKHLRSLSLLCPVIILF